MTDTLTATLRGQVMAAIEENWKAAQDTPLPAISDDDNLFDLGVVDSLLLAEIITIVEEVTGKFVDFLTFDPETFYTLRGILGFPSRLAH